MLFVYAPESINTFLLKLQDHNSMDSVGKQARKQKCKQKWGKQKEYCFKFHDVHCAWLFNPFALKPIIKIIIIVKE